MDMLTERNSHSQVGEVGEKTPSKLSASSLQLLVLDPTRPNPLEQLNVATVRKPKLPLSLGGVLYSTAPSVGAVTGKQVIAVWK